MSTTEVFEEVERWSPEQREELAWRLKMIELTSDPKHRAEIGHRIDEIETGDFVKRDEVVAALRGRGLISG